MSSILGGLFPTGGHKSNESHDLGIFQPLGILTGPIVDQVVKIVLEVIGAALGVDVKLRAVLDIRVCILEGGKLFRITLEIDVKINDTYVIEKYEADIFFPFLGPLECRCYKKIN